MCYKIIGKKIFIFLILLIAGLISCTDYEESFTSTDSQNEKIIFDINIPDQNLKEAIYHIKAMYVSEILMLVAPYHRISDLNGLEYFTSNSMKLHHV